MKRFSYILIAFFVIGCLVFVLNFQQDNREIIEQLHRIESTIIEKDSLLYKTQVMVKAQEQIIQQKDSVIVEQSEMIGDYGKTVDSLSYLMRYLERSTLRERYQSAQPARRPG